MNKIHKTTSMIITAAVLMSVGINTALAGENDHVYQAYEDQLPVSLALKDEEFTIGDYTYAADASGELIVVKSTASGDISIPSEAVIGDEIIPVRGIGEYAFSGCGITSVVIPPSVTFIEKGAFAYCASLSSVSASDNLLYVGSGAFSGTRWYASLSDEYCMLGKVLIKYGGGSDAVVPDNTVCVSDAFAFSDVLTIKLPDSLKYISDGAFSECAGISSVDIPRGVIYIGGGAFIGCVRLENVQIPDTVRYIGAGAFLGTPWYASLGGDYSIVGDGVLIKYGGGGEAAVPEGVKYISDAFAYRFDLSEVSLPDSLEAIGDSAFFMCTSLREIKLPDKTSFVGANAFSGCSSLERVKFSMAFFALDKNAFLGCTSLRAAIFTGDAPIADKDAFSSASKEFAVYFDTASKEFTSGKWSGRPSVSVPASFYFDGDTDGSGKVNMRDILALKKYFAGFYDGVLYRGADVNGDGAVNAMDVTALKRMFVS